MKMEKYKKFELSGIFSVKLVVKNTLLGSPKTHFMHMRVKVIGVNGDGAIKFYSPSEQNFFQLGFTPCKAETATTRHGVTRREAQED